MLNIYISEVSDRVFNPLNTKLNPTCHLLALLGAYHILHVSRERVNYLSS
jgi:hypothetical protein